MTSSKKPVKIELIPGTNRILLIAPHGVYGDDDNTGTLTRVMAEKLKCYAVINEVYQKPEKLIDPKTKEEKKGPADPINKRFDLNNLDHVRKYLNKEFLQPIIKYKKEIKKNNEFTLVVLIHGIADGSISENYGSDKDIVVGIGHYVEDPEKISNKVHADRISYDEAFANILIYLWNKPENKPIQAVYSKDTPSIKNARKYAGWAKNNLNQLFTLENSKDYDQNVDSIQLEIKKSGIRDTDDNIENTAERLSKALKKLLGIKLGKDKITLETATDIVVSPQETSPDIPLVEKAYSTLKSIVSAHYKNALFEAGQYIIDNFYDGQIELARQHKPTKGKSLNQLIKKLQSRDDGSPSRSWIFNAVSMVIDQHKYGSVQTYKQLPPSLKVILLPVKDSETKVALIDEAVANGYSARQLKKRVVEVQPPKKTRMSLNRAINKPDLLFSEDNTALLNKKSLNSLKPKEAVQLATRAKEQLVQLQAEVLKQQDYIKKYGKLIKLLDSKLLAEEG